MILSLLLVSPFLLVLLFPFRLQGLFPGIGLFMNMPTGSPLINVTLGSQIIQYILRVSERVLKRNRN